MRRGLFGAVPLSHYFLSQLVRPADHVVDATCGHGRDTLLLARLVGPVGKVWGFDIQEDALEQTAARLTAAGCRSQVELVPAGHENLAAHVTEPVRAVVFNLGYLPGGDRQVMTRPETTVVALRQATDLLQPEGMVAIILYCEHSGGREECEAVETWAASLSPRTFHVWRCAQLNRPEQAPSLVIIEKTHSEHIGNSVAGNPELHREP